MAIATGSSRGVERNIFRIRNIRSIFPLPLRERKKNHGFGLSTAKTKLLIFQVRGESRWFKPLPPHQQNPLQVDRVIRKSRERVAAEVAGERWVGRGGDGLGKNGGTAERDGARADGYLHRVDLLRAERPRACRAADALGAVPPRRERIAEPAIE